VPMAVEVAEEGEVELVVEVTAVDEGMAVVDDEIAGAVEEDEETEVTVDDLDPRYRPAPTALTTMMTTTIMTATILLMAILKKGVDSMTGSNVNNTLLVFRVRNSCNLYLLGRIPTVGTLSERNVAARSYLDARFRRPNGHTLGHLDDRDICQPKQAGQTQKSRARQTFAPFGTILLLVTL
jgi:hypothetical protein